MARYTFVLLCSLFAIACGQSTTLPPLPVIDGVCPTYTPVATIDAAKMAGTWHVVNEIRGGFGTHDPAHSEKCLIMDFAAIPDGSLSYKWSLVTPDNQKMTGNATTTLIDGKNTKLTLIIGEDKAVMTFLAADPTSHVAYVICESDGKTHRFTVEIASRAKTLTPAVLDQIKTVLTANKLPIDIHSIAQTC